MLSEALKELFILINLACGGALFFLVLAYLVLASEKRRAIVVVLLFFAFACILNSLMLYFLI